MKASVIDLFCGAGGLTHGFELEGLTVNLGLDIDPACQTAFQSNNDATFLHKNIVDISPLELLEHFPSQDLRILAGCAPCQPYSMYSQRQYYKSTTRWSLLGKFSELARGIDAEIVTMENVPQLAKHPQFAYFVNSLESSGYFVSWREVKCADYGVPQSRRRLVLLASKLGPISLIPPTHRTDQYVTVRQTIRDLPPIAAGSCSLDDPLHTSSALSEINLKRIQASRPGGSWKDWPDELVAGCHRLPSGKTYPSVYGRMVWDNLSPTITTQSFGYGNGRFGHPDQDRAISLREAALLQTFPRDYTFFEEHSSVHMKAVGRLIGNAVPVQLARAVARSIKVHLEQQIA
ncbi:MAG: DNA cytosine methyltransferase [Dehalococcoidia bacterium]